MATSSSARPIADRAVSAVLGGITKLRWGVRANLIDDAVDQVGAVKAVIWFVANMPKYERIMLAWGPLRTHYLSLAIGAVEGCRYTTGGHASALALHYFDRHGTPFPIDPEALVELAGQPADEIAGVLRQALLDAGLAGEVPFLDRQLAMNETTPLLDRDDRWMRHFHDMYGWVTARAIAAQTEPDGAHDPINKDAELKLRLAAARNR